MLDIGIYPILSVKCQGIKSGKKKKLCQRCYSCTLDAPFLLWFCLCMIALVPTHCIEYFLKQYALCVTELQPLNMIPHPLRGTEGLANNELSTNG